MWERTRGTVARLWRTDAPLTAAALAMLPVLAWALAGMWLDPRLVGGAPAWLKPAKFAISIAIYCLTLAWLFSHLPEWRRTRRVVGWTTLIVMVAEITIIAVQAGRGTTSHFNVSTPFDAALFTIMGSAIVVQTISSVAVAVALWRQRFADAALGWALRLGMTVTIIGAATGGLMTRPTAAQLDDARASGRLPVVGAHTVGGPDGGRGLPVTGWSLDHGDLRVPHFIGLHAVQALPLLALLLGRTIPSGRTRTQLTWIGAASYTALFAMALTQALRGQPLTAVDGAGASAIAAWATATLVAAIAVSRFRVGLRAAHVPRPRRALPGSGPASAPGAPR